MDSGTEAEADQRNAEVFARFPIRKEPFDKPLIVPNSPCEKHADKPTIGPYLMNFPKGSKVGKNRSDTDWTDDFFPLNNCKLPKKFFQKFKIK